VRFRADEQVLYCHGVWAWIDPERYSQVTGQTPQGLRDVDLEKYLTAVAQQAPT